jgi:hypothetical protein
MLTGIASSSGDIPRKAVRKVKTLTPALSRRSGRGRGR